MSGTYCTMDMNENFTKANFDEDIQMVCYLGILSIYNRKFTSNVTIRNRSQVLSCIMWVKLTNSELSRQFVTPILQVI